MKHWELTPKQKVLLTRTDGLQLEAQFLFRDTVRACFQILDEEECGDFLQFQLMEDGTLKDSPSKEQLLGSAGEFGSPVNFAEALRNCRRWQIAAP